MECRKGKARPEVCSKWDQYRQKGRHNPTMSHGFDVGLGPTAELCRWPLKKGVGIQSSTISAEKVRETQPQKGQGRYGGESGAYIVTLCLRIRRGLEGGRGRVSWTLENMGSYPGHTTGESHCLSGLDSPSEN